MLYGRHKRWLELTKNTWNSTGTWTKEELEEIQFIYNGRYRVCTKDEAGDEIHCFYTEFDGAQCDLYGSDNQLKNGDFESFADWTITQTILPWREPELDIGISGSGIKLYSPRSLVVFSQELTLVEGRPHDAKFYVQTLLTAGLTIEIKANGKRVGTKSIESPSFGKWEFLNTRFVADKNQGTKFK